MKKNVMVVGLLLLTVTVFWQVVGHDFIIFDDPDYVYNNSHVATGLSFENIRWAFYSHKINWHPLTWISHMTDVQIFGLSPRYHHLINLMLHVVNTALLFGVLYMMTEMFGKSLFVASLFALHPLHVESVAWVAERKDVLSTLFLLITVYAYVKYVKLAAFRYYLMVCVSFIFCLMSKPMPVTLPLILLLFDYWPLNRGREQQFLTNTLSSTVINNYSVAYRLLIEKLPLLMLALGSSIITVVAQKTGGALSNLESVPVSLRISNAIVSYLKYVQKMVWPIDLSIIYPLQKHIGNAEIFVALAVFILMCCAVLILRKKYPYLPVGWFFFVISLIPVIGLVQVGSQAMADRYSYMPYTGLFIIITWGVCDLTVRWKRQNVVLALAATIIIIPLSLLTWKQVGRWENSISILNQAASVAGNFFLVQNLLGVALTENMDIPRAIFHLESAIRDKPDFAQAHYNLGNAFEKSGEILKATDSFSKAILYKTDFIDAYFNRAILYARLGEHDKAIFDLLIVIDSGFQPSEVNHCTPEETTNLLGKTFSALGNQEKAIFYTSQAIAYNSGYSSAYLNRGIAYRAVGRFSEANADLLSACQKGSLQGCQQLNALKAKSH